MSPSLLALDENVVAECIRLVALDYGISHVAKVAETCQTFERIWWGKQPLLPGPQKQ